MKTRLKGGFRHPKSVDQTKALFFRALGKTYVRTVESVPVEESLGRVLARSVASRIYLPGTNIAVVDGYAVRSTDLRQASSKTPIVFRLVGESKLGEVCRLKTRRGEAVAVATGSTIPNGADAVVMVERTAKVGSGKVEVRAPVERWQGVTRRGEDIWPGRLVLLKGKRLRPEDIGVLEALGARKVPVARRIRVGVLSTGNELVESLSKATRGKIVDLNRPIIKAMLSELGAVPLDLGIAKDDKAEITFALRTGLRKADVVLVTAGSSVGSKDLVPECINRLGKPGMVAHGVAMRPALPTGLAVVDGKPVVSLPGFPVSAMIAFRIFVGPLIARLLGSPPPTQPWVDASLSNQVSGTPGYRTFLRVRVKKTKRGYLAIPLKAQRSSQLTSMVDANGILTLPESAPRLEKGARVSVGLTGDVL